MLFVYFEYHIIINFYEINLCHIWINHVDKYNKKSNNLDGKILTISISKCKKCTVAELLDLVILYYPFNSKIMTRLKMKYIFNLYCLSDFLYFVSSKVKYLLEFYIISFFLLTQVKLQSPPFSTYKKSVWQIFKVCCWQY